MCLVSVLPKALNLMSNEPSASSVLSNPQALTNISALANPPALSNISALAKMSEIQQKDVNLLHQQQFALQLQPSYPPPFIQMPSRFPLQPVRPKQG